ncbi:hypothetical protein D1AOALGA4SA_9088 [Olavius algarvensis Delta 1 endosymbiont]|nr:hypothetical protein D1AOALGA4SA_9088 [Olavius algarvensis Delta 1 endosymbiont]
MESLRSVFFKNINDRIPHFDIHYSLFDTCSPPKEDSLFAFQSFFFDLTGCWFARRRR